MTPTRMRECLALLRWSQRGLAEAVQGSEGVVRMMARGGRPIPGDLAAWLERLATVLEADPPPALADGRMRPLPAAEMASLRRACNGGAPLSISEAKALEAHGLVENGLGEPRLTPAAVKMGQR